MKIWLEKQQQQQQKNNNEKKIYGFYHHNIHYFLIWFNNNNIILAWILIFVPYYKYHMWKGYDSRKDSIKLMSREKYFTKFFFLVDYVFNVSIGSLFICNQKKQIFESKKKQTIASSDPKQWWW